MDYLDPNKKRAHKRRLFVGYGLFAVMITLATVLLVFIANGYYLDSDSGEVIQNGLVFVDSKPGGAKVYLNGQKQSGTTDIRMVIPGGNTYKYDLKKDGYRDWSRTLIIEGGSLRKLTYARLIPNELSTENTLTLRENPSAADQSIDKRWMVLSYPTNPLQFSLIDTQNIPVAKQELQIPLSLVANSAVGRLEVVEWADDNRFFLASYTVGDVIDYLLIDRENPQNTINLNTTLGNKSLEIGLRDRKRDQYFAFDTTTKLLYVANLASGMEKTPFIDKQLLEYTVFSTDWVAYIVESGEPGLVQARFKRGDQDIEIKSLKTDSRYFVELAKLNSAPIMGFSSPIEGRAVVYLDPQRYVNEHQGSKIPVATTVLRIPGIQELMISSDSTVILGYGPDNMASHEFEPDRSYNFDVKLKLDDMQKPRWLDGQHLSFSSMNMQYTVDFDGNNIYDLVTSVPALGSFYSNSVGLMYTFDSGTADTSGKLLTPPVFRTTNLLTPADR